MKTKSLIKEGKYLIEIPSSLVKLYSLDSEKIFEINHKEKSNGYSILILTLSTKIEK